MELRLWDFDKDNHYIPNFLEGMSLAHHEEKKTEEWFHWKFEKSPYGKAILACAFDNNQVAGCVAYGKGLVVYKGQEWKASLSYETYVHPNYQGKGLFKKLISLAEGAMKEEGVQFVYNFPNSNSIAGFKHMDWICRNDIRCFKIKVSNYINTLMHFKNLKMPFEPNLSNYTDIKKNEIDVIKERPDNDIITPIWTPEYLKWRFFSRPNREYYVVNTDDVFAISMVGKRGHLKCVHILYSISKEDGSRIEPTRFFIKQIKKSIKPDIIEYSSTIYDDAVSKSWGFIKVPAHGNFCYKVLDKNMIIEDFAISLPSINAHTY